VCDVKVADSRNDYWTIIQIEFFSLTRSLFSFTRHLKLIFLQRRWWWWRSGDIKRNDGKIDKMKIGQVQLLWLLFAKKMQFVESVLKLTMNWTCNIFTLKSIITFSCSFVEKQTFFLLGDHAHTLVELQNLWHCHFWWMYGDALAWQWKRERKNSRLSTSPPPPSSEWHLSRESLCAHKSWIFHCHKNAMDGRLERCN
jgi:hypothetical protein